MIQKKTIIQLVIFSLLFVSQSLSWAQDTTWVMKIDTIFRSENQLIAGSFDNHFGVDTARIIKDAKNNIGIEYYIGNYGKTRAIFEAPGYNNYETTVWPNSLIKIEKGTELNLATFDEFGNPLIDKFKKIVLEYDAILYYEAENKFQMSSILLFDNGTFRVYHLAYEK